MRNRSFRSGGINVKSVSPCGYNILVELLKVEEKTEGGIVLTSGTQSQEQNAMPIAKVIEFGPQAYKNMESGCNSPEEWGITVGDYVQIQPHEFQRAAGKEDTNLVYVLDHAIKGKVEIDE